MPTSPSFAGVAISSPISPAFPRAIQQSVDLAPQFEAIARLLTTCQLPSVPLVVTNEADLGENIVGPLTLYSSVGHDPRGERELGFIKIFCAERCAASLCAIEPGSAPSLAAAPLAEPITSNFAEPVLSFSHGSSR